MQISHSHVNVVWYRPLNAIRCWISATALEPLRYYQAHGTVTDSHVVPDASDRVVHVFPPDLRHTPLAADELSADSGRLIPTDTAQSTTASPAYYSMIVVALLFSVIATGTKRGLSWWSLHLRRKSHAWCIASATVLRLATKAMYGMEWTLAEVIPFQYCGTLELGPGSGGVGARLFDCVECGLQRLLWRQGPS